MPPTTLESLPEEILLQICEYLGRDYMASVAAIACASKYCYFAVTALLVRTIKFDVSTHPKLLRDVRECYDMLQRTGSFRHVRRVVDGYWPSHGDDLKPNYQWHRPAISAKERGYGDEILDWRILGDAYATPSSIESVYETNDGWRELANLVRQLPSLVDLIFACNSHFPPCLLQALQHQGQCRLHISKLRLRSLGAPTMDTHDLNLVSSSCLCSIGLLYYENRPLEFHLMPGSEHDGPSYPREAVIRLVAGLAPNLKELHLFQHSPSRSQYNGQDTGQPWKGFTLGKRKRSLSGGSLQFLQLSGCESVNILKGLRAHDDFSLLRTLQFKSGIDETTFDFLTTNCSFPSLTNLALSLVDAPLLEYLHAASRFLRSLPPLCTLTLRGDIPRIILDSTLDYHGSRLRKLHICPQRSIDHISLGDIARIREHCPLLEDLKLAIHRSRGDGTEIAAYKAIGAIPRLRRVSLNLDATNFAKQPETPNCPTFDEFDQQCFGDAFYPPYITGGRLLSQIRSRHTRPAFKPRNGQIRDAFINNAIDGALAQQIFRAISSGKPDGSLPLDRLKVLASDGKIFHGYMESPGIGDVLAVLRRSWQVKRNPQDDSRQQLLAQELQQIERNVDSALHPLIKPIFRKLWPSKHKEGRSDWRNEWHSWPLYIPDT